jgi:hypothetical protein
MKQYLFSRRLLGIGVVAASVVFGLLPGASAQAALIRTDACDNATLTQPFLPWGDAGFYKLVPDGNFEGSSSGWTFTGGAKTVSGSEPFGVTGSVGSSSLYLPAGATAQSPFTCVDAAYPWFRMIGHNDGLLSSVLVQVVYREPVVGDVAVPVGVVTLSGHWQPTLPMLTASAVQGALSGGTAQVALRFTALVGPSHIDDVYVDPRLH